ncbi:MAG: hypothetical protein E7598_06215 [Ruminococcaceae bacterium]|nr:hypothetical protein [Oscillospiraceae bacterium]
MSYRNSEEFKLLCGKALDAFDRAKGDIVSTAFLNPAEQYFLGEFIRMKGLSHRALFFGGAEGAQRKKLFAFPEYISDIAEGGDLYSAALAFLGDDAFGDICALKISGGGFRDFSHRDYLGGILSLGLDRSAVGDIAPIDDFSAYIFVNKSAARFLTEGDFLETGGIRIARDRVKITRTVLPSGYKVEQKYKEITDTVASDRLDCVIAALCNLSRETAKERVLAGDIEHNYETATEVSAPVCENDHISVRGIGKFLIVSVADLTKKGRLRLVAKRFI